MCRYQTGGVLTYLAVLGAAGEHFSAGSRQALGGKNPATLVFDTGRPAQIDRSVDTSGPTRTGIQTALGRSRAPC